MCRKKSNRIPKFEKMKNRSKKAARYGSRAEKKIAEEYGLKIEGTHASWKDAEFQNGVPVEIKACMLSTGYFQIYKKYHRILRQNGGYYALGVYRPHGTGIRLLKTLLKRPSELPLSTWSPTNHQQRQSEKARLRIDDVF